MNTFVIMRYDLMRFQILVSEMKKHEENRFSFRPRSAQGDVFRIKKVFEM